MHAQQAQLTIPQLAACSNEQIAVPVHVENLFNAGAVSLYIGYDTAMLEYVGHINTHPQFPGMLTNAMTVPQTQVGISWSSINPANIANGVMIELVFLFKTGDANLVFMPGGEIATVDLEPITYSTADGMVQQDYPIILTQPESIETTVGNNVVFILEAEGADAYHWQLLNGTQWIDLENNSTYQNVNGPNLQINIVGIELDGNLYRCFLETYGACQVHSDSAMLSVSALEIVQLELPDVSACSGEAVIIPMQVAGMQNVTAFQINIAFNDGVAQFVELTDIQSPVNNIEATLHQTPVQYIELSWSNENPVSLVDGLMLNLVMDYTGGTTPLSFYEGSFVQGQDQQILELIADDGSIISNPYPEISNQPVDQIVYQTTDAQFIVVANDAESYQWYESIDNGENWNALNNGGHYSGVNTNVLSVSSVTQAFDQRQYKCEVTGIYCSLFSQHAVLTVLPLQSASLDIPQVLGCINSQVTAAVAVEGLGQVSAFELRIAFIPGVVSFSALANIHPALNNVTASLHTSPVNHVRVNWTGNPTNIEDGTLFDLVFDYYQGNTGITFLTGSYIINQSGAPYILNTDNGEIGQHDPLITGHPQNQIVIQNDVAQFVVEANGVISYQWYESQDNGINWLPLNDVGNYFGTQTNTLVIDPVEIGSDQNNYKCQLISEFCEVYTNSALLTVLPEMTAILVLPDTSSCLNESLDIPLTAIGLDEMLAFDIYIGYDGESVNFIGLENISPLLDGIEANVYSSPEPHVHISWYGDDPVFLSDELLFSLQFVFDSGYSMLSFLEQTELVNGMQLPYSLTTIDGGIGEGTYPEILLQPIDQTVSTGFPVVFELDAIDADGYQWYESVDGGENWEVLDDSEVYSGTQMPTLTVQADLSMDQYQYKCYVSSEICGLYSFAAVLNVLPEMTAQLVIADVLSCENELADVPLTGIGLSNIIMFELLIAFSPEVASFEGLSNTHPLLFDVSAEVLQGSMPYLLISWSGNEAVSLPDGKLFDMIFEYSNGSTELEILSESYVMHEALFNYNLTTIDGQLSLNDYPNLLAQPQNQYVEAGDDAVFSLMASGAESFQWFESRDSGFSWNLLKEIGPYSGVQSASLTISNVSADFDQYRYRCLVVGPFCNLFSHEATLFVDTITGHQTLNKQLPFNDLTGYQFLSNTLFLNFEIQTPGIWHFNLYSMHGSLLYQSDCFLYGVENYQFTIDLMPAKDRILLLRAYTIDLNGSTHIITKKLFRP